MISNLGYVLCHVFATSGFVLLRRDRPNWPRPIKVSSTWVAICCALFVFDLMLLIVRRGQRRPRLRGEHALDADPVGLILVVALGLYVFRVVVQDKKPLQMRLPAATMPEEEKALDAPTTTV